MPVADVQLWFGQQAMVMHNDIHTQNIENMWMRTKRKLKRQFGTSQVLFPSYLKEFQFRSLVRNENIFGEFQIVLSKMYPV